MALICCVISSRRFHGRMSTYAGFASKIASGRILAAEGKLDEASAAFDAVLAQSADGKAPLVEAAIKERVKALTDRFPIYQ